MDPSPNVMNLETMQPPLPILSVSTNPKKGAIFAATPINISVEVKPWPIVGYRLPSCRFLTML